MSKLNLVTKSCGILLLWATTVVALPAQTFTSLASFNGTDGSKPYEQLSQAADGNLYGTTAEGGNLNINACLGSGCGTVFKISTNGTMATLYVFCPRSNCIDGAGPSGLIQGTDGNFYGTTHTGGKAYCLGGCGTVFKITPSGAWTTLYSFCSERFCARTAGFPSRGWFLALTETFMERLGRVEKRPTTGQGMARSSKSRRMAS
jgi:uncharacterized repeat protein (TIGR03803 family)